MDFAACPKCGAMNAPDAVNCPECKSALDAEPDAPPIAVARIDPEPGAAPAQEPSPPSTLPAFEAAPEVLARIAALEADIAKRPQARALYAQLAQVYVDSHRTDLAVTALERGLAVDPHNATFRHRIAQLTGRTEARIVIPGVTDVAAGAAGALRPAAPAVTAPRPAVPAVAAPRPAAPAAAAPAVAAPRPAAPSAAAPAPVPAPAAGPTTARAAPVVRPVYTARRSPPKGGLSRGRLVVIAALVAALALGGWFALRPSARRIVFGDFRATSPAWSPTGKHLAFLVSDATGSRLGVYDFKAGAHKIVGPAAGWDEAAFSWSPDGLRLAYVAPGQGDEWSGAIHVFDLATGQSKRLAAGSSPHWRPGGQLIAVCRPEPPAPGAGYGDEYAEAAYDFSPRFCRIDPASGAVTRTALAAGWNMALSPLLDRVVFERWPDSPEAAQAEAATASSNREFEGMVDNVLAGGASNVAEGSRDLGREMEARRYMEKRKAAKGAAQVPSDVEVFAADVDRGEPVRLLPAGEAAYPRWTPAGDRILFAMNGASGIEFWTMREDGADRQPVLQGVSVYDPASVRLSANGKDVFFVAPVEGDPGVARLMTGEEPADLHVVSVRGSKPRRLSSKHPFKHRYAVSPDGKRIAYEVLEDVKMIGGAGRSEIWVMSR